MSHGKNDYQQTTHVFLIIMKKKTKMLSVYVLSGLKWKEPCGRKLHPEFKKKLCMGPNERGKDGAVHTQTHTSHLDVDRF